VNRTLSARNRCDRTEIRAAIQICRGSAWRCRIGLRNCASSKTRNAARQKPAGAIRTERSDSGFDGVGALPSVPLGGGDRQPQLLRRLPDRIPHRVGLPLGCFNKGCESGSLWPLERSRIWLPCCRPSRQELLGALGAFFAGLAFLAAFPLLGRNCPALAPTRAFCGFGFLSSAGFFDSCILSSPRR